MASSLGVVVSLYERANNVQLPSSASFLPSNLALINLKGKSYVGVIHKGEFVIVSICEGENEVLNRVVPKLCPQQMVLQGSWIWSSNPLLVLLTTSAVQVLDWDGAILLHTHHLNAPANQSGATALKGVVGLPSGRICVGVHTGEILILNLKESDNLAFVEEGRHKWFSSEVVALASRDKVMVAGAADGHITVAWDEETLKKKIDIDSYHQDCCVTCLEILDDVTIAGYTSGHIRIFNLSNGHMQAEVCAHARSLTSVDVARSCGLVLSTSEDTFARVWKMDLESKTLIEHKWSQSVKNSILVGGRFANEHGSEFLLSVYDAPHLVMFAI